MKPIPIRPLPVRIGVFCLLAALVGWLGWTIARNAWGDSLVTALQRSPNLGNRTRLATADEAVRYASADPYVRRERGDVYLSAAEPRTSREAP